ERRAFIFRRSWCFAHCSSGDWNAAMLSDVRLHGLIAAPFTPFHANGDLKLSVIERQAEHLVSRGVSGAFVCGTTGEGPSMTTQERMDVASRWTQVAREKLTI